MVKTLAGVRLFSPPRAGFHHMKNADVTRLREFSSMKSTFSFEEQISIMINDYC